jgi:hypothetical protein
VLERSISDRPQKIIGQMKIGRHVLCCQCQMQHLNTGAATDDDKNKAVPGGKETALS